MRATLEERARRALGLLEEGDVEALLELCDPEVELRPLIAGVEGGAYRRHDGVRRWFAELTSSFDDRRPRVVSIETVSDRGLISKIDLHLRGRGSGIEIDQTVFGAARFRGELLAWWGFFEDRDEALRELESHPARSPRGT